MTTFFLLMFCFLQLTDTKAFAGVYGNLTLTGVLGPDNSSLEGVDAGTSQFTRCLLYMQELTTDELVWSYENDGGTAELQRNIWTPANPVILGMFSRTMVSVSYANEFLRQSTPEKLSARGFKDAAFYLILNFTVKKFVF